MKLEAVGHSDVFVVKFKANGELAWLQRVGGPSEEIPSAIAVQPNGNAYVIGDFNSHINLGNVKLNAIGSYDIFVARIRD